MKTRLFLFVLEGASRRGVVVLWVEKNLGEILFSDFFETLYETSKRFQNDELNACLKHM